MTYVFQILHHQFSFSRKRPQNWGSIVNHIFAYGCLFCFALCRYPFSTRRFPARLTIDFFKQAIFTSILHFLLIYLVILFKLFFSTITKTYSWSLLFISWIYIPTFSAWWYTLVFTSRSSSTNNLGVTRRVTMPLVKLILLHFFKKFNSITSVLEKISFHFTQKK